MSMPVTLRLLAIDLAEDAAEELAEQFPAVTCVGWRREN